MRSVKIQKPSKGLAGALSFLGDKSLSHRAIIFGALAEGDSHFMNVLPGEDCVCTKEAFESLGVSIKSHSPTEFTIHGRGLHSLKTPKKEIYLGNSGTSMRLLLGVLAGQPFRSVLTGDASLSSRPMRRVTDHLKRMGARIEGKDGANFAPLTIHGGRLRGIEAALPIPSAQVKSALLLAGLYAEGRTQVTEPLKSRDHTERFLTYFGAKIETRGSTVSVEGGQRLSAREFSIAGDISSAAFFMAMALLIPGSGVEFKSILDNPTRTGIFKVLRRMGVRFGVTRAGEMAGPEPVTDFSLTAQPLQAFEIKKEELPTLIDEIPILTVLATQARGTSVIREAEELRVKETDRIRSMVSTLSQMGAKIRAQGDSLFIEGPTPLRGSVLDSFKDHRTAMSLIVAGMIAEGETRVEDVDCIDTSFPNFFALLERIGASYQPLTR